MGKCQWTVHFADGVHTVALEHGYWSGKRRIYVDGQLTHVGGGLCLKVWVVGSRDPLSVNGHPCEVRVRPNFRTNNYDYALMIDGQLFDPGEVRPSSAPQAEALTEYDRELARRADREARLNVIVDRTISATLQATTGEIPKVFRHYYYGAIGIDPRHLVVWYIFETEAELEQAQVTGLKDKLDRFTRHYLNDFGYPQHVLDQIFVSFCSHEDVQKTTGGNYFYYFK